MRKLVIGLLVALGLGPADTSAQTPYLVRDINTTPAQSERRPEDMVAGSAAIFFTAYDGLNGREIHRFAPGEGIDLMLDAVPGIESLDSLVSAAAAGPSAYFFSGRQLFISDGTTAGTRLVRTLTSGSSSAWNPVAVPNGVFFRIYAPTTPTTVDLWWSDGTDAGTHLVLANVDEHGTMAASGARLFFTHYDVNGAELWTSDGSVAGTHRVKDICPGPCSGRNPSHSMADVGGTLYFVAGDGATGPALWRSDGTESGTTFVADVLPESNGRPDDLAPFGSRVLFTVFADSARQLWISDGRLAGTTFLAQADEFGPAHDAGGVAFFVGRDAATGHELWRTDGTTAGTGRVMDGCPGRCDFLEDDTRLGSVPGVVLFRRTPEEMWRSDGTTAGTYLLGSFDYDGNPEPILRLVGRAYFVAESGDNGEELWTTDGTVAGTSAVEDLFDSSSATSMLEGVSERMFFTAYSADVGNELWSTTGDAASTTLVELNPGPGGTNVFGTAALADRLVFTVAHAPPYLWSSDGSPAGTQPLTNAFLQGLLAASNGLAFFAGGLFGQEREPWASDGTPAGTREIADLRPGFPGSSPQGFVPFRGETYFTATVDFQQRLWRTDGTAQGTMRAGARPCFAQRAFRELLFLLCYDEATGIEPWVTDGTEAGTRLLMDLAPGAESPFVPATVELDGLLYFTADVPGLGSELWRTDGTTAGTSLVADLVPGPGHSVPFDLTPIGNTLYFSASTPAAGRELWRTDGTRGGTVMVRDINPGPGQGVMELRRAGAHLVLAAYTPATGVEPWMSDGTTAGTVALPEIWPGPSSALYGNLRVAGRTVYVGANDGVRGFEPWAIATPAGVARVGDIVVHEGDAGVATARFEVSLESPTASPTVIAYSTVAGTAQPGPDFAPRSGTITFAPGATAVAVEVPVVGEQADEPNETFSLELTPLGGAVASDARGVALIVDDDGPTMSIANTSVAEGNAGTTAAALQVTITTSDGTPTPTEKSVAFETRALTALAGTDFEPASGVLTFAAGTPSGAIGTVTVNVLGDAIDEPDEALAVRLTGRGDERVPDPYGVVQILDDDGLAAAPPVEVAHGSVLRATLAAAGGAPDRDLYVLSQEPFASYELVVDEASGEAAPLTVQRIAAGGSVAQDALPVGTGGASSLRWRTSGTSVVPGEHVRVESASCGSACGPDDAYRLRFYETTLRASRFNNANQTSVLILQNRSASPVSGTVFLWQTTGTLLTPSQGFTIEPHGTFVFNIAAAFPGWSGSLTVAHDAPYGMLAGKAVALEPATGFSFDTPLVPRAR